MFKYWGFGLYILSEIEFPELLSFEFSNVPDLTISISITPTALTSEGVVNMVRLSLSPTEYLLKISNVANYYAYKGESIVIEPTINADEKSVRLFLLSNAVPAILNQRNQILFNASAVENGDSVAMFCGLSGVGKSTLITSLKQNGFRVFADDLCVVNAGNNSEPVKIISPYPAIKLWENSFQELEMALPCRELTTREKLPQYNLFYHSQFNKQALPVSKIFILQTELKDDEPVIKKLNAVEAFTHIHNSSYQPQKVYAQKKQSVQFNVVSRLAAQSQVYYVTRPQKSNSINQLRKLIEFYL